MLRADMFMSCSDIAQMILGADSNSGSKSNRRAAGPSAECVTEVCGFAEPYELRNVVYAQLRRAQIFFGEIAADVIENLGK